MLRHPHRSSIGAKRSVLSYLGRKAHVEGNVRVSNLTVEQYNELSDATMDAMLDSLEALMDESGEDEWEVEYSVCSILTGRFIPSIPCLNWTVAMIGYRAV